MKTIAKRTPTRHPQMRPGAGGLRLAHRPVAGSPAAGMAAAILRLYTPSGERADFPEQVLRETPRMAITQQTTNRVQLHFAPRLALNAYLLEKQVQVLAARPSPKPGFAETGGGPPVYGFTLRQDQVSVLVERLVRRGVRIDGGAEGTSATSSREPSAGPSREPAAAPLLEVFPPVQRVFQRPTSPAPAATPQPSGDSMVTASSLRPMQAPKTAEAAHPLAGLDINQLTEQVVRTIDRRITAQRERLGRV